MDEQHPRVGHEVVKLRSPAMKTLKAKARRGFTLVEIMIALAIFAGVMIAIYSSWSSILRGRKIGLEAAREAQRSRVAVRALENSLVSLEMFQANIKYFYFFADTSGDFASLSFVARLPKSFPRSGDFGDQVVRRLAFTVEPGTNSENVLVLRQNPILFDPSDDEEENPLVLGRNVRVFTLEFWGPRSRDWEPEWLYTNQLPSRTEAQPRRDCPFPIRISTPTDRSCPAIRIPAADGILPNENSPPGTASRHRADHCHDGDRRFGRVGGRLRLVNESGNEAREER